MSERVGPCQSCGTYHMPGEDFAHCPEERQRIRFEGREELEQILYGLLAEWLALHIKKGMRERSVHSVEMEFRAIIQEAMHTRLKPKTAGQPQGERP